MKKNYVFITAIILLFVITMGYAFLSANLNINGSSSINNATWNIHFENIQIDSGSVALSEGNSAATITSPTQVEYTISLHKPGDYYEFTVDIVNDGSIDGMIESISSKLNNVEITSLPVYLDYSITYIDGLPLVNNQKLEMGDTQTIRVRVSYKKDIEISDLPSSNQTLLFLFNVNYVQASDTAIELGGVPHSFSTDSWATILRAFRVGNTSLYGIGDTKEVDLGDFGVHPIRIVNTSTPDVCNTEGFSQTACGVVLEFEDILIKRVINSVRTNVGGWRDSELRAYINNDIYNSLPADLRKIIIDTKVVSGHGSTDGETNFVTIDKLYLLTTKESHNNNISDSSSNYTRQLDYYYLNGVDSSNYSGTIKKYNGSNSSWWCRSANSGSASSFKYVTGSGSFINYHYPDAPDGVSPAFRIG